MQRDWGSSRVSCSMLGVEYSNKDCMSYSDPQNIVGVDGVAGATDVLFVTGRVDDDRILWGTCDHQQES